MRNVILFFHCCFFCLTAAAQVSDTTFVTLRTESGDLSKQQIMEQYDYVFRTKIPATWMFKWNPLSGLDGQGVLNVGAEHKISPAFSLQATYGVGVQNYQDTATSIIIPTDTFWVFKNIVYHHISLQSRWYFEMPRRIREGKSANNFSGNYLALELAHTAYGLGLSGLDARFASNTSSAALRFGIQRRVFKLAYFDISYGMGARHTSGYDPDVSTPLQHWDFFASTQFACGVALYRPKPVAATQEVTQCDILQCFREENRMWKIDLFNLVRIKDKRNAKGTVRIAMEQKIAQSPFSVELEAHGGANSNRTTYNFFTSSDAGWTAGAYIQPRFYYRMNKQIAKGKSGNNLAGPYLGLQAGYDYTSVERESAADLLTQNYVIKFDGTLQSLKTGLLWGIQYRMFNHAFIDLNFGMRFGVESEKGRRNNTAVNDVIGVFDSFGSLRVGLAF